MIAAPTKMPSETANGLQTASSSTVIPAQAGIQNVGQRQYSKAV
ncbi:conserved hypothetical protein [Neisseria gonorrhoeae DGI2]|uniref:Uncharacterized protein n=1 Tax=Neisseria gonorrhoeae (strain NCCP11945) TaxID=521006 RepID=B4RNJ7_NEIG2|nr:Hypothetical protein NGK_2021 [Neisseria gonorrhoeae NCCP11945]EFE05019.1 conserved hypothetical protein [Neisseria gonorrhoeae DGI2]